MNKTITNNITHTTILNCNTPETTNTIPFQLSFYITLGTLILSEILPLISKKYVGIVQSIICIGRNILQAENLPTTTPSV